MNHARVIYNQLLSVKFSILKCGKVRNERDRKYALDVLTSLIWEYDLKAGEHSREQFDETLSDREFLRGSY